VATAIFMMVHLGPLTGWLVLPALIILCREIIVSGLREFLAEINVSVPVSRLAKWKTALQMIALGLLLLGDAGRPFIPALQVGTWALWIAALLTLVTGYDYLRAGLRHMTGAPGPSEGRDP
jgi:cardiolipin synthase